MRFCRAALGAGLALLALAGSAIAKPPVWIVHGARGQVVLFGSVHMLPQGVDWRPEALEEALKRADTLWFELPLDEGVDAEARRLTARRANLPKGDALWPHLTASQGLAVQEAARRVGIDPAALRPLRPWMADLTLSLAADTLAGARLGLGVETWVQEATPPTARRMGLETVGQQVGYLSGGGQADQIAALEETAHEIVADPDLYGRTVREWLAGDLEGLRRDDIEPLRLAAPEAYRRLILDRNRRWAVKLARLARRPGINVVVVGAGHLVGPDGVPTLLRARGLTVEGP